MTAPSLAGIALTLVASFVFSELGGYWLHILIHSNKVHWLSNSHMIHHLKLYGPKMRQVEEKYKTSTEGRTSIAGIGLEWLIPLSTYLAVILSVGWAFSIPRSYLLLFAACSMAYGFFLFSYMHKALHLRNFWMLRSRLFKKWFLWIRKLHYIHHVALTDDGRMNKNYGICFFFYDRLFRTRLPKTGRFNERGYKASLVRYGYLFEG